MTPEELTKFYGGQRASARAIGVCCTTTHDWKVNGRIPDSQQFRIERLSGGALKVDAGCTVPPHKPPRIYKGLCHPANDSHTFEEVSECFSYDAISGLFHWKQGINAGAVAGCIDGGYRRLYCNGRKLRAHRAAWLLTYGEWPKGVIDHINGDRGDNRIVNLRDVTPQMNAQNCRVAKSTNKSGIFGVSKTREGKYKSALRIDGKTKWLGTFATAEEANRAYIEARRTYLPGFVG